jgi:Putative polyhydroxyalkanoic acid system protein (PHA_gran_rgn)
MATWKTERSYAGKSAKEIYLATKKVIENLSGKYGLTHQGNDAGLNGKVNRMGVDGTYQAAGDKVTIELSYGFLIPGGIRQKVQDEVARQLDGLFS